MRTHELLFPGSSRAVIERASPTRVRLAPTSERNRTCSQGRERESMRKLFWSLAICGAMVTAGVVASANHAARNPHSFIGRAMHGASYAASKLNPAAGFGPVLAGIKKHTA